METISSAFFHVQRFLQENDPQEALKMFYNVEVDFVIVDPTKIEHPQANKTE